MILGASMRIYIIAIIMIINSIATAVEDLSGDISNNTFIVSEGDAYRTLQGGRIHYSNRGKFNVHSNSVTMTGGLAESIFGGSIYSNSENWGDTYSNSISISGGKIKYNITGGAGVANVYKNNVIAQNVDIGGYIYGGHGVSSPSWNAALYVYENVVDLINVNVSDNVVGGYLSHNSSSTVNSVIASKNEVSIADSSCGVAIGAVTQGTKNSNNEVSISNTDVTSTYATVGMSVMGGFNDSWYFMCDVLENSVVISGGNITGGVAGGYSAKRYPSL